LLRTTQEGDLVDLAIGGSVSRDEIFDLCNKVKDAFGAGKPVRLDGSQADGLTPILAQVILAAGKAASEGGQSFTLVSPSAAMIDAFQGFGLFADLMTIPME
jgi:hypothetical protein